MQSALHDSAVYSPATLCTRLYEVSFLKHNHPKRTALGTILLLFTLCTSCLCSCALPFGGASGSRDGSSSSGFSDSEASNPGSNKSAEDFDSFLETFFRSEVQSNTINLHFTLSNPENYGITETPITLGVISDEAIAKSQASLENTISVLKSYDYDSLSLKQQLTYDILSDYLKTELSAADLTLYDEILRPTTGIQAQLPVLYEEYRFYDRQDIEDYLALIALTDDYFSQIIDFEKEKAHAGLFMSDFACDTLISQCETFIANPDSHYLIQTFNHKVDAMTDLTDAEREAYKEKNAVLVKEHVLPAYENLASSLTELLGSGENDQGLCYFPNGKDYYEYLVYHNTGSSSNAKELEGRISETRTADLTEAALLLSEHPELKTAENDAALSGMDSIATLNVLQDAMLADFPAAPDTEFTVSYIDECMEDYMAPAFYITSPIDNYEKNSIFINASTDATSMRYFTTLAHEGFPGHLYQTVMSYEAGLPPVRSILNFPGYVEGWATYVEMISYGYAGLDENLAKLMSLNQSALLSLYASTDLGIHYDGWSFADTVAFWKDYGITDQKALRDVYELIVEEPSHYLKYYVGYMEFRDLKEKAKETYGSAYSDIAFHKAVLEIGPAPFSIVEKYLDDYYMAEEAAPGE